MSQVAIGYLTAIVRDVGTPANHDPSNSLCADDLIVACWEHRMNEDFMRELEAQLEDMRTGFCPQGRTHRLFQLLAAFSGGK